MPVEAVATHVPGPAPQRGDQLPVPVAVTVRVGVNTASMSEKDVECGLGPRADPTHRSLKSNARNRGTGCGVYSRLCESVWCSQLSDVHGVGVVLSLFCEV